MLAVNRIAERLALARDLGAEETIDVADSRHANRVAEWTGQGWSSTRWERLQSSVRALTWLPVPVES